MNKGKYVDNDTEGINKPSNDIIVGTPTMILLPSRKYCFSIIKNIKITIPRKGDYYNLDKDFFDEDAGEFNIYDENKNILYMPSISKVLFAVKKYPDLEANQLFAPISVKFNKKTVVIAGQVIGMIDPNKQN